MNPVNKNHSLAGGLKKCSRCKEVKNTSEFHVNRFSGDNLNYHCKLCGNEIYLERKASGKIKKYENTKENKRKSKLKQKYGISLSDYDDLLKSQNGRCGICGSYPLSQKLVVDHCHETNKTRGLLCILCNIGLGGMRDDSEILNSAIMYLRKHK